MTLTDIYALFVFYTILSLRTLAQRTPSITQISPDIYTSIGGSIDIDCSVIYAQTYPVLWVKLPTHEKCKRSRSKDLRNVIVSPECTAIPLSTRSSLIIRDNRFSLRYDTASESYTLQIKDIQASDEAIYECRIVIGSLNKISKHVQVRVSQPAVISDNSTRALVVQEHAQAVLFCHANGAPTPTVLWRRKNNAILPTGGIKHSGNVLKIHSVQKEDRGTYYCVAENGVGKPARRSVAVEVEFPPDVSNNNVDVVKQAMGYEVELVCHVEAYPPPTITWIHNGIQLSTNKNFDVDNGYLTTDDFTETSVKIHKLNSYLLGEYICRAQNKLGQAEKTIIVATSSERNCAFSFCLANYRQSSRATKSSFHFGARQSLALFISSYLFIKRIADNF